MRNGGFMNRRGFLKLLLSLFSVTTLLSFLYPLTRFLIPTARAAKTQRLIIPKGEVPPGYARNIVYNDTPAIVIHRTGKGLIAFTRVCTHLGCLVEYEKDRNRLLCPCHAGTFDLAGNVLSGPPPKPLPQLPLRVEGDTIVIG